MEVVVLTVRVGGVEATFIKLRQTKIDLTKAAKASIEAGGKVLYEEVRKNMSLTDHTLDDLAKLDHPYARRHGSIQIHRNKPYQVHRQSGKLLDALSGELISEDPFIYQVWVDEEAAPHVADVIQGTPKMLARDTIWATAMEEKVKTEMFTAIVRTVGAKLRGKMGLRFGPVTPTSGPGTPGTSIR